VKYDPNIHHRRSIRLQGYDYARAGAYFVTIVAQNRACLFGQATEGQMQLNPAGEMVEKWWFELENKFPNVTAGDYVIMPNHFHGIIVLHDAGVGVNLRVDPVPDGDAGGHGRADT
jgi:putative transposase